MGIFEQNPEKLKQDEDCFQKASRKEEADHIKWISPIVWQNVNLLDRFEFHMQQSMINIDEMISLLKQKIVWQQPKVIEEELA